MPLGFRARFANKDTQIGRWPVTALGRVPPRSVRSERNADDPLRTPSEPVSSGGQLVIEPGLLLVRAIGDFLIANPKITLVERQRALLV